VRDELNETVQLAAGEGFVGDEFVVLVDAFEQGVH
jgi:hypothetical protein